jgi:hypothetical protein
VELHFAALERASFIYFNIRPSNLEVPPVEPPPQPPRDFNVDKQVVEGLSIEQYDFHSDSDDSDDDIRVAHKATNAGPAV